jgi:hypothetical protein
VWGGPGLPVLPRRCGIVFAVVDVVVVIAVDRRRRGPGGGSSIKFLAGIVVLLFIRTRRERPLEKHGGHFSRYRKLLCI